MSACDQTTSPGSSPLARGLQRQKQRLHRQYRIIPARAGFTSLVRAMLSHLPDHPRSRGVYRHSMHTHGNRNGIIPARAGFTGRVRRRDRHGRDHPRSRGVYAGRPLTGPGRGGGIIPARAGFTSEPGRPSGAAWDHPRSRGVYGGVNLQTIETDGSSPLARGLRGQLRCGAESGRIIPARAGFTTAACSSPRPSTDHPRSRGVYDGQWEDGETLFGSSPLARGLPVHPHRDRDHRGIIPARAGFTGRGMVRPSAQRDHPRSRGVYVSVWSMIAATDRIIPARAGFTGPGTRSSTGTWDHPRSRGVYVAELVMRQFREGSSPLARGLQKGVRVATAHARIIPARAGFTYRQPQRRSPCADHPRSRGVYMIASINMSGSPGSSPLARGLLFWRLTRPDNAGIIPARAGFTAVSHNPPPGRKWIIPARAGFT